jgi:uncharacterized protein YprB with RNaseH-like and TPR domain
MLKQTFIHIPGIGKRTELELWNNSILCWEDFIQHFDELQFTSRKKLSMRKYIDESIERLQHHDHKYFARLLPRGELWRAYPDFSGRIAYLDIETTGLFSNRDEITLIGLYDGKNVKTYINGINLGSIDKELERFSVIVTFNGARFDLPFIQKCMPHIALDHLHIDLLYPLRRLGYRGGLKSIERQLGIERESDVSGLTGWDAVRLWYEYKNGSSKSLDTLIKYNSSDIVNLEELMTFTYKELKKRTVPFQ